MVHSWREALANFIRANAKPSDKFSHQPRLYRVAVSLAQGHRFDDDVLYAAAWMHDLGVFIGHRPDDVSQLAQWDHIGYATTQAPGVLRSCGFPLEKIPAVLEAIRSHMPSGKPSSFEGVVLRDADILEQLGAVGILRTVSKVGRDTRFISFNDALRVLNKNLADLPGQLNLPEARRAANARVQLLKAFLDSAAAESAGVEW
jgi:uncharacterized protein